MYPFVSSESSPVYSVFEITSKIRDLIEEGIREEVWVQGEVFDIRSPSYAGHLYFSLKDDRAMLSCAMWRMWRERLGFEIKNGMLLRCRGRIQVYEPRGVYQLIVREAVIAGRGDLWLAFERLKKKLKEEGLFDQALKRPIPFIPRRIGIVTSASGAAFRDMVRIILSRYPAKILLAPAQVQGDEAPIQMIEALKRLSEVKDIDVIIIGRGGGSIEDLWAFNSEDLARAIRNCPIPVISAVGHEIDWVITDFVADFRASTPSVAAEKVVPSISELKEKFKEFTKRIHEATKRNLEEARLLFQRFEASKERIKRVITENRLKMVDLETRLVQVHPKIYLERLQTKLNKLKDQIEAQKSEKMRAYRERLTHLLIRLNALDPFKVLDRGYSITYLLPSKKILKDSSEVKTGQEIESILYKGSILSRVEVIKEEGHGISNNEDKKD
jgi:exodeoxyribonuclease VII large subunit